MKRSKVNFLAVMIVALAMAFTGCSPSVQSSGSKKDTGVEQHNPDDDDASSDSEDTDLSDAGIEDDDDADWEGPGEDQDVEWDPDGGEQPKTTCSKQGLAECFLNSDCENPAHSCQNIDDDMPTLCCAPGVRGKLEVGKPCGDHGSEEANNEACASGMCLDNGTKAICTQRCDEETGECPAAASECVGIAGLGGVCIPPDFEM